MERQTYKQSAGQGQGQGVLFNCISPTLRWPGWVKMKGRAGQGVLFSCISLTLRWWVGHNEGSEDLKRMLPVESRVQSLWLCEPKSEVLSSQSQGHFSLLPLTELAEIAWFVQRQINEPGHEKTYLMSYANNKGCFRCLDSIISLDSIAEIWRL